jgi:hypothetical protein
MIVEIGDRDHAIAIAIGISRSEPLHDGVGEQRGVALTAKSFALPRVLQCVRSGQYGPPVPLQTFLELDAGIPLRTNLESSAVAAV